MRKRFGSIGKSVWRLIRVDLVDLEVDQVDLGNDSDRFECRSGSIWGQSGSIGEWFGSICSLIRVGLEVDQDQSVHLEVDQGRFGG